MMDKDYYDGTEMMMISCLRGKHDYPLVDQSEDKYPYNLKASSTYTL